MKSIDFVVNYNSHIILIGDAGLLISISLNPTGKTLILVFK